MLKESPLDKTASIILRPIAPQDESFLLSVYASTRMEEMALVPWTDAQREAFVKLQFDAQHEHYQSHFPNASYHVIEHAEQPIGRLYVLRTDEFIRILDITLLPEFRNMGFGTKLLKDLMDEAEAGKKPLRIYVESFNPSLRLFERLGFTKSHEEGMHFLMERQSSNSSDG